MSDKKNIDRLFQEKFKDFEVAPNDAVWNRISESLPHKKKKRRVIALWWQLGGVAAVIAILLTVGVSVFNSGQGSNENLPVVNTDKNNTQPNEVEDGIKTSTLSQQDALKNEVDKINVVDSNKNRESVIETEGSKMPKKNPVSNQLITPNKSQQALNTIAKSSNENEKTSSSQKRSNLTTNTNNLNNSKIAANTETSNSTSNNPDGTQLATETEIKSAIKKTIEGNKTAIAENTSSNNSESESESFNSETNKTEPKGSEDTIIEGQKKPSIEDAIAENTNTINEEEEDKQNRWSIAPNVAPVYYSSLGQGSSLDMQFIENSKSSDINMSYGIAGSYAISKKIKIRAGVNRVNLSQTTSDVFAFTGAETAARGVAAKFGNISFEEGTQQVSLMSSNMMNRSSVPELFNTKIAGNINQEFGFIEVPLELEYRVLDKKFGINVIGGFSTFFLNQNDIYADINGASTLIGEANNISDTSFSANFGLGMDYNLSKQWNINLEPTFKYQINTFNNTSGDFRPFFIGVYTGLSFKF